MAGSSVVPAFVNKFGMKKMLIIGGITFTLVVISQILPSEYQNYKQNPDPDALAIFTNKTFIQVTLIISAVISGFGAAAIWVSQGKYLSLCSQEAHKGFYFGYFWVWYMSAQIIGNLTGAILISNSFGPNFFYIISGIEIVALLLFVFIPNPKPFENANPEPE